MSHKTVGQVTERLKQLFQLEVQATDIRVSEDNLRKHMMKRGHENILPYVPKLSEILESPDFVGVNPREKGVSLEYIKCYDDNVLVAIKLHKSDDFFYVPTMYEI